MLRGEKKGAENSSNRTLVEVLAGDVIKASSGTPFTSFGVPENRRTFPVE